MTNNHNDIKKLIETKKHDFSAKINSIKHQLNEINTYEIYGHLISAIGTSVEAYLPGAKIGDLCKIEDPHTKEGIYAEVLSLNNHKVKLLPFGNITDISQDCVIKKMGDKFQIRVGDFLLGKVVNGFGDIIDTIDPNLPEMYNELDFKLSSIYSPAPDPQTRPLISTILKTGVKSIDLLNTCGQGQRVGIFAGPGMGKTTLMGMIIRNAEVDVVVVGLVGERGREVREFIEIELGTEVANKCILVVATSDKSSVEQLKCAYVAQTIAEYFRDQGKNVLLFLDSVTRFARAGREVGLSAGESPARGGYPSSVFLSFPKLMERAGNSITGSISAFYTILMEGENISDDVIADEIKSILDGHIILSKKLVERGQFPAIDNLKSLSRVADRIINKKHLDGARKIRLLLSQYEELEFLIRVGEYQKGINNLADEAVDKNEEIQHLLKQNTRENVEFNYSLSDMLRIAG